MLTLIDEYARDCLASVVTRRLRSHDVRLILADRFLSRGIPTQVRSDKGPEFIARTLSHWLRALNVAPLSIEPGSPWKNGSVESLNGKMREPLLNGERFDTLKDAQIMTERWRRPYHTTRRHSSLGGQPPAPETIQLAS